MGNVDQCQIGPKFSVFEIGGRVVDNNEIFRAADFVGTLEPCRERLIAGLVAACRAGNRGLVPSVRVLQSMSDAFRYERDLITAEETERWLEHHSLALEDFHEFFLRRHWMARMEGVAPDDEEGEDLPALQDLERPLLIEVVMSGEFDRMVTSLSRRLALAHDAEPGHAPPSDAVESARARFLDRAMLTEAALPKWLARIRTDGDWLEEMLRMDAAYSLQCEVLLVPQARERTLRSLRLPLTRIDVELLELKSDDAAREAHLCIGQDGVAMADLARECGHPHRRLNLLLGDLDEELSRVFLNAAPGEVLAPIENEGAFLVCRLVGKTEPDLSDTKTRERIDERILNSYFDELTARHVRWRLGG